MQFNAEKFKEAYTQLPDKLKRTKLFEEVKVKLQGREYNIPIGSTHTNFVHKLFNPERLCVDKKDLPLIKGLIYGDTKQSNGKKLPEFALVTIDVDSKKQSDMLELAVQDKFVDRRVFTSLSASGKVKAHFFVSIQSFRVVGKWVDHKELSGKMCEYLLGCLPSKYDPAGSAQCFMTQSLFDEIRNDGREHSVWNLTDLDALLGLSVDEQIKQKTEVRPFPEIPEFAVYKAKELLVGKKVGKAKETVEKVLAAFLIAKSVGIDNNGNKLASVSQDSLALRLSVSVMAVSRAMNKLVKLGLISIYNKVYRKVIVYSILYSIDIYNSNMKGTQEDRSTVLNLSITNTSDSLLNLIHKYKNNGLAITGSFNRAEVGVCLLAVRLGVSYDDLLDTLSKEWIDWYNPKREKRLRGVYRWAKKKLRTQTKNNC